MRLPTLLTILAVFGLLATGCKSNPNKVCKHIEQLGDAREGCASELDAVAEDYPDYWADIAACFIAATSVDELGTCDEVIATIRLQTFCDDVLARIPDAYRGSSANCLRAQRATLREAPERWEAQRDCVAAAGTADEVRACPGASPRIHRVRRGDVRSDRESREPRRGDEGERRPMRRGDDSPSDNAPSDAPSMDEAAP